MRKDFYFNSKDGVTKIHAVEWTPDGEIKAVFQIVHGMTEHIYRYDEFAKFLNSHGILVVGHDHLGHGQSIINNDAKGYFKTKGGNECLIEDIHTLRTIAKERYPNLPYFIMGHSMGSFITREYIAAHGEGLSSAIIMGTGFTPGPTLLAARALVRILAMFNTWHHRSRLITWMAFGSYQKRIKNPRSSRDWLTRNTEVVDRYRHDPDCMFIFTLNGYDVMFEAIQNVQKRRIIKRTPKDLPLYFTSGLKDPVGNYGGGVRKVLKLYSSCGLNVSNKFYEEDRHEILNELDKETVFADILAWINQFI